MTQKEYTGPEFEIEFARADYEWKKGGKVGVDPHCNWEYLGNGLWGSHVGCKPSFYEQATYRWKPAPKRTIRIGYMHENGHWVGKVLVAPEVEAPADGTRVWIIGHEVTPYFWSAAKINHACLEQGRIFLTQEDAQAMSDWLATCRKGGQS